MAKTAQTCPRCDAPAPSANTVCAYCGAFFGKGQALPRVAATTPIRNTPKSRQPTPPPISKQALAKADFGIENQRILHALLSINLLIISLGWALERPGTYWSSDAACITWLAGPTLWSAIVAILWRGSAPLTAPIMAVAWTSISFMIGIAAIGKRLNGDAIGLSLGIGSAALAGFILGHFGKRARVRAKARA